jgi:hypothetical protein
MTSMAGSRRFRLLFVGAIAAGFSRGPQIFGAGFFGAAFGPRRASATVGAFPSRSCVEKLPPKTPAGNMVGI